jgi:hypothetical protein
MSCYGATYAELEKELQILVNGPDFRERVAGATEDHSMLIKGHKKSTALTPIEAIEILLESYETSNLLHQHVLNYFVKGTELPIFWNEAVDLWIEVKSRESTWPPSPGSIAKAKRDCLFFTAYAQPSQINCYSLDKFVSN